MGVTVYPDCIRELYDSEIFGEAAFLALIYNRTIFNNFLLTFRHHRNDRITGWCVEAATLTPN